VLKKLQRCQQHNQAMSRRMRNEIYQAHCQIHVFLADQGADSLLSLVCQQFQKEHNDMFLGIIVCFKRS
jgi:hypothetical protein